MTAACAPLEGKIKDVNDFEGTLIQDSDLIIYLFANVRLVVDKMLVIESGRHVEPGRSTAVEPSKIGVLANIPGHGQGEVAAMILVEA